MINCYAYLVHPL